MAIQQGDQSCASAKCCPTEFNMFLRKRIRNMETLRLAQANFVAMDTEHRHRRGFSSIGLAFASKLEPVEHPAHPAAMTGILEQGNLETHLPGEAPGKPAVARSVCFNIRGFERSKPTKEQTWGQPDQDVDAEDVSSKLVEAVQQFRDAEPERPLILVTYSSRAELSAISNLVPQFCHLFSGWVDLQPLVMDAYHEHTDYARLDGLRISLRYAMRTLGFCTGYQPSELHHAGNDALRTLAIMACLTHENAQFGRINELENVPGVNELQRAQLRLKGTEMSRGLKGKRPGPPSTYPHVAKVTVVPAADQEDENETSRPPQGAVGEEEHEEEMCLPPVDARVWRPRQVWDFFSPYKPDAIGRVCKEKSYYVCVPSPEVLQHLIQDLNHTSASGQTVLVEDASDPHALGAAKREERAKRRQEQEIHDLAYLE